VAAYAGLEIDESGRMLHDEIAIENTRSAVLLDGVVEFEQRLA
jgi:hypothetical protein